MPVKTSTNGSFRFEARNGSNGALMRSAASDYVVRPITGSPATTSLSPSAGRVYAPGAGGKLYYRDDVDSATGTVQTAVFYGAAVYTASPAQLDAAITITTPVTVDTNGTVFFGFIATQPNPANLTSGFARLAANGTGTWIAATAAASDAGIDRPAMNSAPAISRDGAVVYVAATNAQGRGYLLGLDSATLTPLSRIALRRSSDRNTRVREFGCHLITNRGSGWRCVFWCPGVKPSRA